MKILLSWLREYLDLHVSPDRIASALTMAGLEVEAVHDLAAGISGVVVGRILTREPHPNAEKLVVCQVDVGGTAALTIVCGAPNADPGARVPVARIGARLPGGFEIRKAKLRGVESSGMMCSRKELGLGDDHSGLLHLPADAPIGEDIVRTLGLDDVIFEIGITPNRGDALSHHGIARELSAIFNLPLLRGALDRSDHGDAHVDEVVAVTIEAEDLCPRYGARVVEDVAVGPSPQWLQRRLERCGIRPINNVVDVTNYVMLDIGHPMHAFDFDRVRGAQIVVRRARPGETLVSLDAVERKLETEMLVIADSERPVALAGVMGGADTEIGPTTRRVLLEAAWFEPKTVRKTARRLGMLSESSYRFERGTNIDNLPIALNQASRMLQQLAGGRPRRGIVDVYPHPVPYRRLALRTRRVQRILGMALSPQVIETLLLRLKLEVTRSGEDFQVGIPPYRHDLQAEIDLIEEVARLFGYQNLPVTLPSCPAVPVPPSRVRQIRLRAVEHLVSLGLSETMTYSFIAATVPEPFRDGQPPALLNPMSEEQNVLRTQLSSGLYAAVRGNALADETDVAMFEIGKVFSRPPVGELRETLHLGIAIAGQWQPWNWTGRGAPVDLHHLQGLIGSLTALFRVEVSFSPGGRALYHPTEQFEVWADKRCLGHGGRLHPTLREHRKIPEDFFLAEIDLEALAAVPVTPPKFRELPTRPAVFRDLALLVPLSVTCQDLLRSLREAGGPMLVASHLFDVYQGKGVPADRRSLAFRLAFRAADRTLTDAEIDPVVAAMVETARQRHQAELRAS